MSISIRLKHSSTANKAPLPSDLAAGELALNTNAASPAAYLKDSAGNIVKLAGAGAVGATDATTTAKGVVQLADATAVTAGTAGRVVDAAQLKAATDADDWTRTGTTLSPKTAGDVVEVSAGTKALPGLTPVGDPSTGIWSPGAGQLAISTNGAQRVTVDSSGRSLVGTSSTSIGCRQVLEGSSGGLHAGIQILAADTSSPADNNGLGAIYFTDNSHASGTGLGATIFARRDGGTWTSGSSQPARLEFSTCPDSGSSAVERMRITAAGQTLVQGGSVGPLTSDERLKTDIIDAPSQWDDIKAIRLTKYRYKNDPAGHYEMGPIAQELAKVCPGLIVSRSATEEEIADPSNALSDGDEILTYKMTILYMKAVKALQEAMERIEALEAKVVALESKP